MRQQETENSELHNDIHSCDNDSEVDFVEEAHEREVITEGSALYSSDKKIIKNINVDISFASCPENLMNKMAPLETQVNLKEGPSY